MGVCGEGASQQEIKILSDLYIKGERVFVLTVMCEEELNFTKEKWINWKCVFPLWCHLVAELLIHSSNLSTVCHLIFFLSFFLFADVWRWLFTCNLISNFHIWTLKHVSNVSLPSSQHTNIPSVNHWTLYHHLQTTAAAKRTEGFCMFLFSCPDFMCRFLSLSGVKQLCWT